MYLSIFVKIANRRLIGLLLYMYSIGFLKIKVECLFMLNSYYFSRCIFIKSIIVVSLVQMHYLLDQTTSLKYQSIDFEVYIIDQYPHSMCFIWGVAEWNSYYVSALLVCNLELYVGFIKHRRYRVLPEDDGVPAGGVMEVVGDDGWAIVMEE